MAISRRNAFIAQPVSREAPATTQFAAEGRSNPARCIMCAPLISAVAVKRQQRIVMRDCRARIVLTGGSARRVPLGILERPRLLEALRLHQLRTI
jgi:hypothetical protein